MPLFPSYEEVVEYLEYIQGQADPEWIKFVQEYGQGLEREDSTGADQLKRRLQKQDRWDAQMASLIERRDARKQTRPPTASQIQELVSPQQQSWPPQRWQPEGGFRGPIRKRQRGDVTEYTNLE